MFGPNGADRIFYCHAGGNMFAPTPGEKERIQQRLAQGTL
jgi:cytochrome c5